MINNAIIDGKEGERKVLNKHFISNICWDSKGTSLSSTYNPSIVNNKF